MTTLKTPSGRPASRSSSATQSDADGEEELGPLRERRRAPSGERVPRRLDGRIDLLGSREVDGAGLAAGRRVVDRAVVTGAAVDPASADPVRDAGDGGRVDRLGHGE